MSNALAIYGGILIPAQLHVISLMAIFQCLYCVVQSTENLSKAKLRSIMLDMWSEAGNQNCSGMKANSL